MILSFAFVTSSDVFFCDEDQQKTTHSQAPVHCCVQCCPSHNLASPAVNIAQLISSKQASRFIPQNLDFPLEIYPNQIDRPPIA